MKKVLAIFVSMVMMWGISSMALATNEKTGSLLYRIPGETLTTTSNSIKVQQNGKYIDFTDSNGNKVEPQLMNDRTMVPFRKIFNSLGVTDENISWDGETQTIVAKKDNLKIELQIDNTTAKKTVDGQTVQIILDSAPVIVEGRTLVPVRFIAESMNKKVGWDGLRQVVIIVDTEEIVKDLEDSLTNFMEMANDTADTPEIYTNKIKVNGKLNYTDKNNKQNNTSLKLSGNLNIEGSKELTAVDALLKLSGKGSIYDALKENKLNSIDFNAVMNEDKIFLKSSLLESQIQNKWLGMDLTQMEGYEATLEMFKQKNDVSLATIFEVDESYLTISTYDNMKLIADVMKAVLKNDNITIKQKGSTKTYEFRLKLSDLRELLEQYDLQLDLDNTDAQLSISSTVKDGILQSVAGKIVIEHAVDDEKISFELSVEGKITEAKKVSAKLPNDSEVVDVNEL